MQVMGANTRGIDIVVTNKDATKTVTIQCKTWPMARAQPSAANSIFILRDILSRLPRMSNRDDHAPLLPFNWTPPTTPVTTA